ncbi:MAG TPA: hypothetical protein VEO53_16885 [Candidatus Binatia bacterium]|nr:hypothetical protein [Candidatus Binatia bacterium]
MPSVSGLSRDQRIRCRDRVVQAAKLALANKAQVHFTEDLVKRWDGIRNHRNAALGQFPVNCDCSAFATWCLWNGLLLRFGLGDIVNGLGWHAGYTGTMLQHGRVVQHPSNALRGDCVFYGSAWPADHVTIVVHNSNGMPMVISQGSEPGPFYIPYNYGDPIYQIRRYI